MSGQLSCQSVDDRVYSTIQLIRKIKTRSKIPVPFTFFFQM